MSSTYEVRVRLHFRDGNGRKRSATLSLGDIHAMDHGDAVQIGKRVLTDCGIYEVKRKYGTNA